MSLLFKIIFAVFIFFIVGSVTLLSIKDVSIPQEEIAKTIPANNFI